MQHQQDPSWLKQMLKPEFYGKLDDYERKGGNGYIDCMDEPENKPSNFAQACMDSPVFVALYEWVIRPTMVRIFAGPNNGLPSIKGEFAVGNGLLDLKRRRGTWLDLSCGAGFSTRAMLELAPNDNHVGLDISGAMLISASKTLKHAEKQRMRLIRGDVYDLPFEDNSFDGILNVGALQLYPDELGAFREVHRVLKPGGIYVVSTMAHNERPFPKFMAKTGGIRRTQLDGFEERLTGIGFEDFLIINFGDIFFSKVVKSVPADS